MADNRLVTSGRLTKQQLDSHCWRFFFIKYGIDYTRLNRERIRCSCLNL